MNLRKMASKLTEGQQQLHKALHFSAFYLENKKQVGILTLFLKEVCRANHWTGFYMIATSIMKGLMRT